MPATEEAEDEILIFTGTGDEASEESAFYEDSVTDISNPVDTEDQEYFAEDGGEAETIIEEAEISGEAAEHYDT